MEQLREHFNAIPPKQQASGWEAMWQKKVTPWDRSSPNPALVDSLREKTDILQRGTQAKRKRALVPGCGRGYDVLLFSSFGYDAWGLDTAPSAIKAGEELRAQNEREPGQYPVEDKELGAGSATFLLANFFEDAFVKQTGGEKFDVIYDYTFLCALPPAMRTQWASRMRELLAEDGTLICLEFPLHKPPSTGGPPHGLSSKLYGELFKDPGKDVSYDGDGYAVVDERRTHSANGLQRIAHWEPARSHAVGSSVMVSMWQHVKSAKT